MSNSPSRLFDRALVVVASWCRGCKALVAPSTFRLSFPHQHLHDVTDGWVRELLGHPSLCPFELLWSAFPQNSAGHESSEALLGGCTLEEMTLSTSPSRKASCIWLALIFSYELYSVGRSNSLDTLFCLDAREIALDGGRKLNIFQPDQGCHFTSGAFAARLQGKEIESS